MYLGSERFFSPNPFLFLSDIGKFIGIMGGRIQIAPTGMNVVIIDPMENIQIRKLGNVLNMR